MTADHGLDELPTRSTRASERDRSTGRAAETPGTAQVVVPVGATLELARQAPGAAGPAALLGLQAAAGNRTVSRLLEADRRDEPADVDAVLRGPSQPLAAELRREMEGHLDADLSSVRLHRDAAAAGSAAALGARAYTVGEDVVFGAGAFAPDRPEGRRTLAHELTHVVQQRSGPVDGTARADGLRVSHPADRFEQAAARSADAIASTARAAGPTGPAGPASAGAVQRETEPEEEELASVQGAWIAREVDPLEEEEMPGQV